VSKGHSLLFRVVWRLALGGGWVVDPRVGVDARLGAQLSVLGLVGGAPRESHRASPIHQSTGAASAFLPYIYVGLVCMRH